LTVAGKSLARTDKTYSCVHWLRTKRSVIEDFPHPPSPQIVMLTRWESSMAHVGLTSTVQLSVAKCSCHNSAMSNAQDSASLNISTTLFLFHPTRNRSDTAAACLSTRHCRTRSPSHNNGRAALRNVCFRAGDGNRTDGRSGNPL
jgi:hypothetical protein